VSAGSGAAAIPQIDPVLHCPALVVSDVVLQVTGFISALLLAYFTGAWRQYGRRMERLYALADKLPENSEVRHKFEAAGLVEAERAAEKLDQPPRSVRIARQVVAAWAVMWLISVAIIPLEDRGLLSRFWWAVGY